MRFAIHTPNAYSCLQSVQRPARVGAAAENLVYDFDEKVVKIPFGGIVDIVRVRSESFGQRMARRERVVVRRRQQRRRRGRCKTRKVLKMNRIDWCGRFWRGFMNSSYRTPVNGGNPESSWLREEGSVRAQNHGSHLSTKRARFRGRISTAVAGSTGL